MPARPWPLWIAAVCFVLSGAAALVYQVAWQRLLALSTGVGIYSTTAYNLYESYNGTSMATPHVTGAVALYASVNPGRSAAQIKSAILSSAVPTASLSGKTVTGGRLDAYAALSR